MSLANYCVPLFTHHDSTRYKLEKKDSKGENESQKNLILTLSKNNENKKKQYKTFVALARERKFKTYLNKKDNGQKEPNEICSSMIIKNINSKKSDAFLFGKTSSNFFKSTTTTFITENRTDYFNKTKNIFNRNILPELNENIAPSVINIIPAVINPGNCKATIDPDFFLKHSERLPDKSNLINFNTNPKLNKNMNSFWKKNIANMPNHENNENSTVLLENSLFYSNAFNKFHPNSNRNSKQKIFSYQKNLDVDPLAVKSNIRQEMKKRNLLGASRSDLKEIIRIKADLLEYYRDINNENKGHNHLLNKNMKNNNNYFGCNKVLFEKSIEDFLDSDEKNVLGYYTRLNNNTRGHSINYGGNRNNVAQNKGFKRNFSDFNSFLGHRDISHTKNESHRVNRENISIKYKKDISIPMIDTVSEHLYENKNSQDKDDLNRRMHNQDKNILLILKKINPNKEDLNKLFERNNP